MSKEIPYIACESNFFKQHGVEIMTIDDLSDRKASLENSHRLDFYVFIFYTKGQSEHLIDFSWHKVKRNTLVYLIEGQVNGFKFNEGLKGFVILFTKDYLNKQLNKIPKEAMVCLFTPNLFPSTFNIPEDTNTENYLNLLYKEFKKSKDDASQYYIIDSLYAILFAKIEQLKKHNVLYPIESNKLSLFLEFENLMEKKYQTSRNASFYAEKLNITYQHLNALCKEVVHLSTKQFIDEFVILEAKRKLVNSDIKSSELAYSMGFDESTNFVKYFKKHTSLTPNQFKKLHLK